MWERGVLIRGLEEKEKGGDRELQHAAAFTFRDACYCGRKLAQKKSKDEILYSQLWV